MLEKGILGEAIRRESFVSETLFNKEICYYDI